MGKYKTYEKYKPSGVEWLGDIPEHWSTIRIKFSTYVKGRIGWHGLKSDEFTDEGTYLVTGTDFDNNQIDWSRCYHVSLERYAQDPYIQLQNGDLLITKDGTIGKTAIVSGLQGYATLNSGIFLTRPLRQDYLPEFLYWVLNSNCFYDYVNVSQTGTTINHLYQCTFENFAFQIPPIEEQKQIARFLDRETTRIDTLITKKRQLIALLQKKRNSIINEAVTKGLNFGVDLKDSGISFIGEMPKHWETIRLKFVVTHVVDCLHSTPSYDENGEYPAIRTADIRPGILDVENSNRVNKEDYLERIARLKPETKDVIYSREGERFGMAALVPEGVDLCLAQRVMMFRVNKWIDPKFFMWLLNADCMYHQVKQDTVGATSPRVNIGTIVEAWLPIPPKDEQEKIGLKISESCLQIDKIIRKIQDHILMIERFRQSLITNSVTGKIDIRKEVS
jgi:type I restriction enzyme S subunit